MKLTDKAYLLRTVSVLFSEPKIPQWLPTRQIAIW